MVMSASCAVVSYPVIFSGPRVVKSQLRSAPARSTPMDLGPRADRDEYELRSGGPANATKQLSPRRGRLLPLYAGDESGTPPPSAERGRRPGELRLWRRGAV